MLNYDEIVLTKSRQRNRTFVSNLGFVNYGMINSPTKREFTIPQQLNKI
jgi:hypothetical protein